MGLGRPRFDARWESESDVVFRLGFASSANSIDVRYPFAILAGLSVATLGCNQTIKLPPGDPTAPAQVGLLAASSRPASAAPAR